MALSVFLGLAGKVKAQYSFTTIDVPGAINPYGTQASGRNDSGQIVGYYQDADSIVHGFLFHHGIYTTLDVPGSFYTLAYGINDWDQIVGLYADGTAVHGFLLDNGRYTTLDAPGAAATQAIGINVVGQIVGDYGLAPVPQGFLLHHGIYTRLDPPGSAFSVAVGINAWDQIVGFFALPGPVPIHGFLLDNGRYMPKAIRIKEMGGPEVLR